MATPEKVIPWLPVITENPMKGQIIELDEFKRPEHSLANTAGVIGAIFSGCPVL